MDMKLINAQRKVQILKKYLHEGMSVLDFGCGDLVFAQELFKAMPSLHITGVDVVDFGSRPKGIRFKKYDGKSLPFKKASFDIVISYHVFHHTPTPFALLFECMRVAKKQVLFVEPVYRGLWDIPGMRIMDWFFNAWKDHAISMPYAFASKSDWMNEIKKARFLCTDQIDVELLPKFLPTGRSLLFVCKKIHAF
ncbi:MAG: class I SAM-dependent methyltransferase [Patescibacteria group bacterium]